MVYNFCPSSRINRAIKENRLKEHAAVFKKSTNQIVQLKMAS